MAEAKQGGWVLHSHGQGRKFGPLSEDELRSYFRAGMVKSVDRLSSPGDDTLHAAADVAAALGETVPVGPPPPEAGEAPKTAMPTGLPRAELGAGAGDSGGEDRALRAAAAMNLDLAAMMATSTPAKKSTGWVGPVLVVLVLVVMLFVGLNMVRKLKPQPAPGTLASAAPGAPTPAATPAVSDAPAAESEGPRQIPGNVAATSGPSMVDMEQQSAKAESLKRASDWAGLVSHASQWAKLQPDRDEPLKYLGIAYAGMGNLTEAEVAFKKVIGRSPQDSGARSMLAQIYEQAQRFNEAATLYKLMVAEKPNDAVAWNNYGAALSGAGQQAQAVVALENAVHLDPSMKQAWTNLGNLYQSMGEQTKAQAAFANAK